MEISAYFLKGKAMTRMTEINLRISDMIKTISDMPEEFRFHREIAYKLVDAMRLCIRYVLPVYGMYITKVLELILVNDNILEKNFEEFNKLVNEIEKENTDAIVKQLKAIRGALDSSEEN